MTLDRDRERQLHAILTTAEDDAGALRAAARQVHRADSDMASALGMIAQLREVRPARAEIDAARLRVGQRLTRDIFAGPINVDTSKRPLRPLRLSEPPETATLPAIVARPKPGASPSPAPDSTGAPSGISRRILRSAWRRAILAATVAAALFLALGGGISVASAQSLPESPLYSAKRIEESILLALPLGDGSRAQALGMIAQRRLAEAQSEANAQHDTEVLALVRDYGSDMRQLIMLAASVSAHGGDNSSITAQIAQVVEAEQTIQLRAASLKQTAFSQELSASANDIAQTLKQQHITLPSADGSHGKDNGSSNGKGNGATPKATPTIGPTPTPKATPTIGPTPTPPGASGSHSHRSGSGNTSSSKGS